MEGEGQVLVNTTVKPPLRIANDKFIIGAYLLIVPD